MGARRTGHTWAPGIGWVKKQETESAKYDGFGDGWAMLLSFIRWFPDFLQDLFLSDEADYELTLIQRVIMRVNARYQYVDITGSRSLTKTFSSMNEAMDEMILWPGIKFSYYGPSYKQMAKIASQTYRQIQKDYPGIAKHFIVDSDSADKFQISTPFGSRLAITAFRGDNVHAVIAEEYAQEKDPPFDAEEYRRVVLPSVRLAYKTKGKKDMTYVPYKQHTITSAGRRQNHSYETRERHYTMMQRGESAFVMDVPYDVLLLLQMRPWQWAEGLKAELTPEEWMREMESYYTGTDENPIVSDATLSESRCLMMMEEHHCCFDKDNKLNPEDVIYVVGYDVSYASGARNAKCAAAVIKCTKQTAWMKKDKYLKQAVWINDWEPKDPMVQAKKLKQVWARYYYDGSQAYIAIDAWQYGTAVAQALMTDLGDGLPPLCCYEHSMFADCELDGALPVIYPIRAGGVGTTDPDSDMVRYMETQFAYHNIELLTSNHAAGMEQYKRYHRIKDDHNDYAIYLPYKKTVELVGQIQNLKKQTTDRGVFEKRISNKIQRDSWSALKYACRFAQILERKYLMKAKRKSDWDNALKNKHTTNNPQTGSARNGRLITGRSGGRRFS